MKHYEKLLVFLLANTFLLGGCSTTNQSDAYESVQEVQIQTEQKRFSYTVQPETFEIEIQYNGKVIPVSKPSVTRQVADYQENGKQISWRYPEEAIQVKVTQEVGYLDVVLISDKSKDTSFVWPQVAGTSYILPLGEGKLVPSQDPYWQDYLEGKNFDMMENLSMRFFGVNHGDNSLVYVMDDLYHSQMAFEVEEGELLFRINHDYEVRNPDDQYGFRIYVTESDPVEMAKIYKSYLIEKGEFKTLKEKAKENPEIEKLYGASHVYLWDHYAISEENIDWQAFKQAVDGTVMQQIKTLLQQVEGGREVIDAIEAIVTQDYVDNYQKNLICRGLTEVIALKQFCTLEVFKDEKLVETHEAKRLATHKELLQKCLPDVFEPVDDWADSRGVALIEEMRAGGIERLWIGLDHWKQGLMKPELVTKAVALGYLIGPYDSYHSIHEPGKEQWDTAAFTDRTLYEEATVIKKDGGYEKGFQGVGRKLNPTLAKDAVKDRINMLEETEVPFNSWFVDCDATGEIYDDYSTQHPTTAQEDVAARLWRMDYIGREKGKVVGSEGGNDFAGPTIAFAHGLELKSFSWMDEDMKSTKDSPYYMGRYYNPKGGVPERFARPIPIKDKYKRLFLDQSYNIPLFKLVYNDALITTYHWDWSTFKIEDEVENRMLYELLYNVPPLYHLDKWEWAKYKDQIFSHSKIYQDFSQEAIKVPMTDYQVLTEDRLVQMTCYGDDLSVIANFGEGPYCYDGTIIDGKSLILVSKGRITHYKP